MSVTAETVTQPAFDPNVINFGNGVEVSARHLGDLMTGLYHLDEGVYPFLSDQARDRLRPHYRYTDPLTDKTYVELNPKRRAVEQALPHLAPVVGKLLNSEGDGPAEFSPEDAAHAKAGLLPLMPSGMMRDALGAVSDEALASDLNVAQSGLPAITGLSLFDAGIRAKVAPQLETVEPFVRILAAGEKLGVRGEFQQEVSNLLGFIEHNAQARAASRERAAVEHSGQRAKTRLENKLHEQPGKYVTREDVAAGIAEAIRATLSNEGATPMLHGLANRLLAGAAGGQGKENLKINIKGIEVVSDLLVHSLLRALPEQEQKRYQELFRSATSASALSFWGQMAIHASGMVPEGVRRKLIRERMGVSEKDAARLAKHGKQMYRTLHRRLPDTMEALSGTLPTADKRRVIAMYNRLQQRLGPKKQIGSAALQTTVQSAT